MLWCGGAGVVLLLIVIMMVSVGICDNGVDVDVVHASHDVAIM